MIDFKPIRLEDKSLYESYLFDGKERPCGYSFGNLFLWGQQNATILYDHMVIFSHFDEVTVYFFPVGKGDKKPVLDAIMEDAQERNIPIMITGMCRESQKQLEDLYPGQFLFQGGQAYDDYVYAIHDLADLKGRKYHRKKNHYNRFVKNNPSYYVKPLAEEDIPCVKALLEEWYRKKMEQNPETEYDLERDAIHRALENYRELQMESLVLYSEGEVIAFTMASRLSHNTLDVHFEKAREGVDGAYTAINCEFAKYIREKCPEIEFLNREEDMGYEGLRKAKESYYPHHMVEKCRGIWKGNQSKIGPIAIKDETILIGEPTEAQMEDLRKLWKEAFGDTDAFLELFYQTGFHQSRSRCITMEAKVVSALYWFDGYRKEGDGKPIAYIYAVATSEEYQGQGLCHKLMQDTLSYLKETGYEGALLVPADEALYRFYHHMGFENCSRVNEFVCTSQEMNVSIRPIESEEYAALRKEYLPEGGIIQENENMDFLATLAHFYAGEDFLLAASQEEDMLRGVELLGDSQKASGILHALGYEKGHFRTPGEEIPFAMYYSLVGNGEIPSYFGLAFD